MTSEPAQTKHFKKTNQSISKSVLDNILKAPRNPLRGKYRKLPNFNALYFVKSSYFDDCDQNTVIKLKIICYTKMEEKQIE